MAGLAVGSTRSRLSQFGHGHHHVVGRAALCRKVGEESVDHAGPANEPVVERFVGIVDRGRIRPDHSGSHGLSR